MFNLNVDFLGANGMAQGDIASYIKSNGVLNPNVLRPFIAENGRVYVNEFQGGDKKSADSFKAVPFYGNATLRRDEWKQLDQAVIGEAKSRLNGVQDLIENNLVFNIGNGMAKTVLEYHTITGELVAELSMDGIKRNKSNRPDFGVAYMPLPILSADYDINQRVLLVSRNPLAPSNLDTSMAAFAARTVAEQLEAMLFTATSFTYGGGTIYSYLNEPNRNLATLSLAWDDPTKTGAAIITEVLSLKQKSINDKHYGPWMIYIPTAYETKLDQDYDTTTPGTTIRERILKISGIKGIKVVDTLTADNVLLVQMTSDVVRLVQGMPITNVEWQTEGPLSTHYKVMTIQVPQVRSDAASQSGIVHLS